jgi:hypothetical protein
MSNHTSLKNGVLQDTKMKYRQSPTFICSLPENVHESRAIDLYLTFRGPCILIYCYNKTNKMHQFLKSIFGIELYMFQTGFLFIIRRLALYTQQQVYVIQVTLSETCRVLFQKQI